MVEVGVEIVVGNDENTAVRILLVVRPPSRRSLEAEAAVLPLLFAEDERVDGSAGLPKNLSQAGW